MKHIAMAFTLIGACLGLAQAQTVQVQEPWARATVAGQKATGAFMQLTANGNMKLVGVKSPVAGVTEIHEMRMDGNTMKMSAITSLALPTGKMVELRPGSYHVMLMDLKEPLKADSKVALTLTFENDKGQKTEMPLEVPVRAMGGPAKAQEHQHEHKH
jgi:periplasmic copper chaperone A